MTETPNVPYVGDEVWPCVQAGRHVPEHAEYHSEAECPLTDGYLIVRDKLAGKVYVTIFADRISTQRADSVARGMFTVPVRLAYKVASDNFVTRVYDAIGWL